MAHTPQTAHRGHTEDTPHSLTTKGDTIPYTICVPWCPMMIEDEESRGKGNTVEGRGLNTVWESSMGFRRAPGLTWYARPLGMGRVGVPFGGNTKGTKRAFTLGMGAYDCLHETRLVWGTPCYGKGRLRGPFLQRGLGRFQHRTFRNPSLHLGHLHIRHLHLPAYTYTTYTWTAYTSVTYTSQISKLVNPRNRGRTLLTAATTRATFPAQHPDELT